MLFLAYTRAPGLGHAEHDMTREYVGLAMISTKTLYVYTD